MNNSQEFLEKILRELQDIKVIVQENADTLDSLTEKVSNKN